MKTNSGRSWVWIGKRAPGSTFTTCISKPSVVATSLTDTPWANVDGRHGRSSVFTDRDAPRSSMLIVDASSGRARHDPRHRLAARPSRRGVARDVHTLYLDRDAPVELLL